MPRDYVTKILKARVYDVARETPLELAPKLTSRLGSEVWLKREDLQPVFSFKVRGAYNKLASLTVEERARGVIASSAGNHAQGVALAARHLGIRALIVMPETAPRIKVDAVERLGAEVVLAGESYDGAKERADVLAAERGMVFIPPFDDEHVIAGQGTVAMEIVRQQGEPFDAVFVEVGGGGLIAGISAYIKALWPQTRVIGVEPQDTPTLHAALAAGERVVLNQVGIFADGTYGVSGFIAGNGVQFVAQLIAAVVAVIWALGTGLLLFNALKLTMGLRASPEEEMSGLDVPEHGEETYPVEAS